MRKTEWSLTRAEKQNNFGTPKSGPGYLRALSITKFKSHVKRGFTNVVVTRAGGL